MPREARSPQELFEAFWTHARRAGIRTWLFEAICRSIVWNAPVFSGLVAVRHALNASTQQLMWGCVASATATAGVLLWLRRRVLLDFAGLMDDRYQAQGKIVSAVEFLRDADRDPYRRLAIEEAGAWLIGHPDLTRPKVSRLCYLTVPALVLLCLVALVS